MADMLAAPTDLANALQIDLADLNADAAILLLEAATAVVQEAAGGQRLIQVAGDSITILGTTDSWLDLPQRPVTAVTSVSLDGVALTAGAAGGLPTTYRRRGARLWRTGGWQTYVGEPSDVAVVYTHGFLDGAQGLELARGSVLAVARGVYGNPTGATSVAIDDYRAAYDAAAAEMAASPNLEKALARQYGRRAGLVRIG
jgi:hypothetical protein